jgi:hypothetical protein
LLLLISRLQVGRSCVYYAAVMIRSCIWYGKGVVVDAYTMLAAVHWQIAGVVQLLCWGVAF